MSTAPTPMNPRSPLGLALQEDLKALQANWFWILLLGIALTLIGVFAIARPVITSVATVIFFGWFLIIGGIFYLIGLFGTRCWGGFFLELLAGILSLIVGAFMVGEPVKFAAVYTLFLAILFLVQGAFRIVGAVTGQFRGWGWVLFSGVITMLLGILIWQEWPYSGLWVIGLFIGIEFLFSGIAHIGTALAVRSLPLSHR